jgi:hypothetical protein
LKLRQAVTIQFDKKILFSQDLVVKVNRNEIFRIDGLVIRAAGFMLIKSEVMSLFRNTSYLLVAINSVTNMDALAHQARLFQDCQIKPDLKVSFVLFLARPEEPRQSYDLARIVEAPEDIRVFRLYLKNEDSDIEFPLNDLSVETFRELNGWHLGMSLVSENKSLQNQPGPFGDIRLF